MWGGIIGLIIQLSSGAVGGNVAGAALKQYNLGTLGNSIAGIIGGGVRELILDLVDPARIGGPSHQLLAGRRRDEGTDRARRDNGRGGRHASLFVGGRLP